MFVACFEEPLLKRCGLDQKNFADLGLYFFVKNRHRFPLRNFENGVWKKAQPWLPPKFGKGFAQTTFQTLIFFWSIGSANFGRPGRPNFVLTRPNPAGRVGRVACFGPPPPGRRRPYMDPKIGPNLGQFWVEFWTQFGRSRTVVFGPPGVAQTAPKYPPSSPKKCQSLRFRNPQFWTIPKKWPYFRGHFLTTKRPLFW